MGSPTLGLVCLFEGQDVYYRTVTGANLDKLYPHPWVPFNHPKVVLEKIDEICLHNTEQLLRSVVICKLLGIHAFRITSGLWPLYTHPKYRYKIKRLPSWEKMKSLYRQINFYCRKYDIHLSLHPGQYTVLTSTRNEVTINSYEDLNYHCEIAKLVGARDINLHLGGIPEGNKKLGISFAAGRIDTLSMDLKLRITIENDDKTYHVRDLLKLHEKIGVPICYDVHHHRCNPDGLSVEKATNLCLQTWNRTPHFHISSTRDEENPRAHHDFINPKDWPECWDDKNMVVDVEAKSKEFAVLELQNYLLSRELLETLGPSIDYEEIQKALDSVSQDGENEKDI